MGYCSCCAEVLGESPTEGVPVNRADSPIWRRTGLRLAAGVLASGCVLALPAAPALAAPAHATKSWGHINAPATQTKPVVLPSDGRSWALRTH